MHDCVLFFEMIGVRSFVGMTVCGVWSGCRPLVMELVSTTIAMLIACRKIYNDDDFFGAFGPSSEAEKSWSFKTQPSKISRQR